MPQLLLAGKIIVLQALVAVAAVYVLKRLLEKDLVRAALEQVGVFDPSDEARRAERIVVLFAGDVPTTNRAVLAQLLKEKCPRADIDFLEDPALMGGLVIEIAGKVMDYSLANRLKYLFGGNDKKDSGYNPGL